MSATQRAPRNERTHRAPRTERHAPSDHNGNEARGCQRPGPARSGASGASPPIAPPGNQGYEQVGEAEDAHAEEEEGQRVQ